MCYEIENRGSLNDKGNHFIPFHCNHHFCSRPLAPPSAPITSNNINLGMQCTMFMGWLHPNQIVFWAGSNSGKKQSLLMAFCHILARSEKKSNVKNSRFNGLPIIFIIVNIFFESISWRRRIDLKSFVLVWPDNLMYVRGWRRCRRFPEGRGGPEDLGRAGTVSKSNTCTR